MDKTEMRLDPLTEAWTLFCESRLVPPTFASVRTEPLTPSPFLAGREALTPRALFSSGPEKSESPGASTVSFASAKSTSRESVAENADRKEEGEHVEPASSGKSPAAPSAGAWQVRVVPNRSPLLRIEGDPTPQSDGFYDHMDGVGAHEIIVEDPTGAALETLPLSAIEKVIVAWKLRMLDLLRDSRLRAFLILKNVGAPAGARVDHSLSQLLALAVIPPSLLRKLRIAQQFFAQKKRSIFADILAEEFRTGTRLVYENNGFAVFCPYAARAPFELAIYPKRQCPDFHGLTDQETAQLADALKTALGKLNRALDYPPYNLLLFTAPTRTARPDHWTTLEQDFRWHVEILPRLHFRGGVEIGTGCWVNNVWPETAAEYLRSLALSEP